MTRAPRRRPAAVLVAAALALTVTACSPASPQSAPSGVDGLVVPVVEPDPSRFVAGIDHPYLEPAPADADAPGPVVAGVRTTAVPAPGLPGLTGAVDLYAQDDLGNVWWFGRQDVWAVGVDGARAGLVLTATPRLGDGYRAAVAPEAGVDLVSEVVAVDATLAIGATTYDDVVVVETRDLVTGAVQTTSYAAGVGRVQTLDGD